jgi:hypothetical protein
MSFRTDVEYVITPIGSAPPQELLEDLGLHLADAYEVRLVSGSENGGSEYVELCPGHVYVLLRDTHPDEKIDAIRDFSRQNPELELWVEEYVHEKTDMVDAGYTAYAMRNGASVYAHADRDKDVTALLDAIDAVADTAHITENDVPVMGNLPRQALTRLSLYHKLMTRKNLGM